MTYTFEREDMNNQKCIPATSEMILHVKKWFWYNKFKFEIDNDGIHTNEYLYGFSWNTPAPIISAFYKAQIYIVNTYTERNVYGFQVKLRVQDNYEYILISMNKSTKTKTRHFI